MIREHWKDGRFFFVNLKRIHVHVCNKAYRHHATLSTRKLRENSVRSTGSVRLKKSYLLYTVSKSSMQQMNTKLEKSKP